MRTNYPPTYEMSLRKVAQKLFKNRKRREKNIKNQMEEN